MIDETTDESFVNEEANIHGLEELKEGFKKYFANPDTRRVERVVYHEMIGEGDTLAVWQTNYSPDGKSFEGVTIAKFKNGKLTSSDWIEKAPEEQG